MDILGLNISKLHSLQKLEIFLWYFCVLLLSYSSTNIDDIAEISKGLINLKNLKSLGISLSKKKKILYLIFRNNNFSGFKAFADCLSELKNIEILNLDLG